MQISLLGGWRCLLGGLHNRVQRWVGAKLKSKTHLQNTFFDFLSRFLHVRLQSLQKVLIWPKKKFFGNIRKDIKNRRISRWFRIRWKSCKKNATKQVISKKILTNMSKKWKKGLFSVTFLLITFFMVYFFKTISTDSKSAWNSAFFDTHIEFFHKKISLFLLALFVNFDCKCAGNGSKKRKIFFYECVLEFY